MRVRAAGTGPLGGGAILEGVSPDDESSMTAPDQREAARVAWLEEIVGPGYGLRQLAGDASFRRYFRVQGPLDSSRVLMDAPPDKEDVPLFRRLALRLAAHGVPVPEILASEDTLGFLLLSDLGDELLLDRLACEEADPVYRRAIALLVEMQSSVPVDGLEGYSAEMLLEEMRLFPRWFLERHLGLGWSGRRAAVLECVFELLVGVAGEQPTVFVHRDYHSRNLMALPGGRFGVLDFQDAVEGPVTYDLVSLLRDVYVEWDPAQVARWSRGYFEQARARGIVTGIGFDRFARWFDLMGVQRHLKVAGIFCRLWHRDGKGAYLESLPLTLKYLMTVSGRYRELDSLRKLLEDIMERTPGTFSEVSEPTGLRALTT